VVLSKVTPDELAFLRLGVVGHQPKTPLALITKGLQLRDELAHTGGELVRRHDDGDAAVKSRSTRPASSRSDKSTSPIRAGTPAE
jgi:hypothetical protein